MGLFFDLSLPTRPIDVRALPIDVRAAPNDLHAYF
jgi:hypothetical protein